MPGLLQLQLSCYHLLITLYAFTAHPAGALCILKQPASRYVCCKLAQDCCRVKKLPTLMPVGGIRLSCLLCNIYYIPFVPSKDKQRGAKESACVRHIMSNVCRQL